MHVKFRKTFHSKWNGGRKDYYEGFITEPYTLRSMKFLEIILPTPLILNLRKTKAERCDLLKDIQTI